MIQSSFVRKNDVHLRKFDLKLSGIAKFGKRKKKKTLDNTTQSPLSNLKKSSYVLPTLNLFDALRGAKFASIKRVIRNTTFVT